MACGNPICTSFCSNFVLSGNASTLSSTVGRRRHRYLVPSTGPMDVDVENRSQPAEHRKSERRISATFEHWDSAVFVCLLIRLNWKDPRSPSLTSSLPLSALFLFCRRIFLGRAKIADPPPPPISYFLVPWVLSTPHVSRLDTAVTENIVRGRRPTKHRDGPALAVSTTPTSVYARG